MDRSPHKPAAELEEKLSALSVLLVEDNFLVAMAMERALVESGCTVIGPVGSVEEGKRFRADCR